MLRAMLAVSWAAGLVVCARPVLAQEPSGSELILAAEQAYEELEVERAAELGEQALQAGGNSPRRVLRIYRLLGLAYGATNDMGRARQAYLRLIALDPVAPVDTTVAPRLREPFFQARAYWANRPNFGVTVELDQSGRLQVSLEDPLEMTKRLAIRVRYPAEAAFSEEATDNPGERTSMRIEDYAPGDAVEYVVEGSDEHGNRIIEHGLDDVPQVVQSPPLLDPRVSSAPQDDSTVFESPWFWVIAGTILGAAGLGLFFLLDSPSQEGQVSLVFGGGP